MPSAGFKEGDVLSKLNQHAVPSDLDAFAKIVSELSPNSSSDFTVLRRGDKEYATTGITGVNMPAEARYQPRRLRADRALDFAKQQALEAGFAPYQGQPPAVNADRCGFSLTMANITRKHDFTVEFFDEDNIRGKRRFKILSVIDMEPQVGNLNITGVLLRKPKFKLPTFDKEKGKDKDKDREAAQRDYKAQAELAGAFLITPDAFLPFECPVKDDYGLTSIGYNYKVRRADVELVSQGGGAKVPVMQIDQAARAPTPSWSPTISNSCCAARWRPIRSWVASAWRTSKKPRRHSPICSAGSITSPTPPPFSRKICAKTRATARPMFPATASIGCWSARPTR